MSDLSPLERLRARYDAQQQAHFATVDLFEDGSLVARVGSLDTSGARALGIVMARIQSDDAGELTDTELAEVIAAATRELLYRDGDHLAPLLDESGAPVTLRTLGSVLGMPAIDQPADAVKVAFTIGADGGEPRVDGVRLLNVVLEIAEFVEAAPAPGR